MRILARVPPSWRDRVDSFGFWNGVMILSIVGLTLWLAYTTREQSQTAARQAKSEAIRISEAHSAANSSYQRCIASIGPTMRVSTHVAGVNEAFAVLLRNSRAARDATPRDDPQYAVRAANAARLEKAFRKVAAVKSFPAPTRAECAQRRKEALRGIDP